MLYTVYDIYYSYSLFSSKCVLASFLRSLFGKVCILFVYNVYIYILAKGLAISYQHKLVSIFAYISLYILYCIMFSVPIWDLFWIKVEREREREKAHVISFYDCLFFFSLCFVIVFHSHCFVFRVVSEAVDSSNGTR